MGPNSGSEEQFVEKWDGLPIEVGDQVRVKAGHGRGWDYWTHVVALADAGVWTGELSGFNNRYDFNRFGVISSVRRAGSR